MMEIKMTFIFDHWKKRKTNLKGKKCNASKEIKPKQNPISVNLCFAEEEIIHNINSLKLNRENE